jgi:hypothetical protein
MRRYSPFLAAILGVVSAEGHAASLSALLKSVPPPPADPAMAVSWVENGQIVAPEYLRIKQAIEAEHAAIAALNGGQAPVPRTPPPAVSGDAPEVQGAVVGYQSYLSATADKQEPEAALGKRTRWIQAAMGMQLKKIFDSITPCPAPCADATIAAANAPGEQKKQALMEQEIRLWTTLFSDWMTGRQPLVDQADARIMAAGEGAKATTEAGRLAVAEYRASVLKEVEVALSITELTVKRASAIATGQVDAISGASKSKKAS